MLRAAESHRDLGFVSVNRRTHAISFASALPETNKPVIVALRPQGGGGGGGGKGTGVVRLAEARALKASADDAAALASFVKASLNSASTFLKLPAAPAVTSTSLDAAQGGAEAEAITCARPAW